MFRGLLTFALILSLWMSPVVAAQQDEEFRIGVFPRRPAADSRRLFEPLARYLSTQLGIKVTLETPADYPAFWDGIKRGRYQLVHYNPYHYVRAHHQFGHQVIAMNEEFGHSYLRATLYVREDSELRTIDDLRGRKVLFGGDRSAFIGYILGAEMLRQAGLQPGDYIEQYAQNPLKAIIALHYRQGDAAVAGDEVLSLPELRRQVSDVEVRAIAQSIEVPHVVWAVTEAISASQQIDVKRALLALNDSIAGHQLIEQMAMSALLERNDADFDIVRQIVRNVLDESY